MVGSANLNSLQTGNLAAAHELDNLQRRVRVDNGGLPPALSNNLAVEFNRDSVSGQFETIEDLGNRRADRRIVRLSIEQETNPIVFEYLLAGHRAYLGDLIIVQARSVERSPSSTQPHPDVGQEPWP